MGFSYVIAQSKTILWNGPLGYFEKKPFDKATAQIATYLSTHSATTIIGGGDSVSAIRQLHLENKLTHTSTGGGAALEFLEGKDLPGIAVLQNK